MIVKKAYAKINLGLDVLGRRDDGYHIVKMIMQTVDLHDVLTFEKRDDGQIVFAAGGHAFGAACDQEIPIDMVAIAQFVNQFHIRHPPITALSPHKDTLS